MAPLNGNAKTVAIYVMIAIISILSTAGAFQLKLVGTVESNKDRICDLQSDLTKLEIKTDNDKKELRELLTSFIEHTNSIVKQNDIIIQQNTILINRYVGE